MIRSNLHIGLAGNCQVIALQAWLKSNLPEARLSLLPPYHMLSSAATVEDWLARCADADVVLAMPIRDGYKNISILGSTRFKEHFTTRLHFYPNLYSDSFFPFFGYAKSANGSSITVAEAPGSPHGDYHDFLAMAIHHSTIPWGRVMRFRLELATRNQRSILTNANRSLNTMKCRLSEMRSSLDGSELQMMDFLGYTFNHPASPLLNKLYMSIWTKILAAEPQDFRPLQGEPFGSYALPVPAFIYKAIAGNPTAKTHARVADRDTYEEELKRAMRYYQKLEGAWIAAANRSHPKFQAAKRFLRFLSW